MSLGKLLARSLICVNALLFDSAILPLLSERRWKRMSTRHFAIVAAFACTLAPSLGAFAQQKYTISQPAGATSKFTQEHVIEVGDVPGHQLRVYEVQNEFPRNDLAFGGVVAKQMVSNGLSDSVNGSGSFTAYNVYSMADGSRVFVRLTGTTQSDGAGGSRSVSVENFVGGTGKFKGIRGQMRNTLQRASGSGVLNVQVSGEYWMEE
jgi:hypothetical protein